MELCLTYWSWVGSPLVWHSEPSTQYACVAVCIYVQASLDLFVAGLLCLYVSIRMCLHIGGVPVCFTFSDVCRAFRCEPWTAVFNFFFFLLAVFHGLITQVFTPNHRKHLSVTTVCRQKIAQGKDRQEEGKGCRVRHREGKSRKSRNNSVCLSD